VTEDLTPPSIDCNYAVPVRREGVRPDVVANLLSSALEEANRPRTLTEAVVVSEAKLQAAIAMAQKPGLAPAERTRRWHLVRAQRAMVRMRKALLKRQQGSDDQTQSRPPSNS
jgi:hypothetical protein